MNNSVKTKQENQRIVVCVALITVRVIFIRAHVHLGKIKMGFAFLYACKFKLPSYEIREKIHLKDENGRFLGVITSGSCLQRP